MKRISQIIGVFSIILISICIFSPVYGAGQVIPQIAQTSSDVLNVEVNGSIAKQLAYEQMMYLGGNFTQIKLSGSAPLRRNNFAAINLQTQAVSSWNPSFNGPVEDIEAYEDVLYVVGQFTEVDGKARPYLALFDSNTQKLVDTTIQVNNPVYAVERYENTLFLGGSFTQISNTTRNHIASLSLPGNTVSPWNPNANGTVYAILVHNNILYVAGAFTEISGQQRNHIASFYLPSGELSNWAPSTDTTVSRLQVRDDNLVVIVENQDNSEREIIQELDVNQGNADSVSVVITASPEATTTATGDPAVQGLMVDTDSLGFQIPTLSDLLTFAIRIFFVIAGLAALFYMLIGAFSWVTSGGDKDAVAAARDKIQSAIVGLIMMVVVLAIVWTLEQVIFKRRICLGISCPLTLPSLLEPTTE